MKRYKQHCEYPYQDQILNVNGLREVPDFIENKNGTITSYNPKLYDTTRAIRMTLDRASTTGSVPLKDIYNTGIEYEDQYCVNNGQITYYIDNEIKDAFYKPIYDIPFKTIPYMYRDPMTSYKPHYILVNSNQSVDNYSPLTSINDTSFHRENLIASQQAKFNQTRITPFY